MFSRCNILLGILSSLLIFISYSYPTYDEYLQDFNKTYSSQDEIIMRKQLYDSRIYSFAQIIDYTPGVNNFTDWTEE